MEIAGLDLVPDTLPAPLPMARGVVDADAWRAAAKVIAGAGGRLVAVWGSDRSGDGAGGLAACAAYALPEGLVWLDLPLRAGESAYPDIAGLFPCAGRMQRAAADLVGLRAEGAGDVRPWLNHGAWPKDHFPLRVGTLSDAAFPERGVEDYRFVRVQGDGVHEIPVGPVHAGIIEPGHFRFSIVGEKVLRLEQRLGYKHKGIEKRFTQLAPLDAHRLAGRVSGDSTVAYAWAYCMALESIAGTELPQRAAWLRAMMLERERVANHLGDLGALGNDAALAFGLAQFSRLREDWQRGSKAAFGHRMMMDCVVPGGVAVEPEHAELVSMRAHCEAIEREVLALRAVYDEHAGLEDRFMTTGRVSAQLAQRLGLTGLAGRASGLPADLRCDHPWAPYAELGVRRSTREGGDVAARVAIRFDETIESLRLIRQLCAGLEGIADARVRVQPELPPGQGFGAGWIEGWRGEVFVALELDAQAGGARIRRCHCHDPSWQNWPVLEHAVIGNIVPDFPLINKSFNLSYSGHDL
jgi:Ni,Fe-hydrogenase III large subunit/Ni,Fe-hydrogenase III component G